MTERDDIVLLGEFAATESETAFAALVERHLNLVYSVALRSAGNAHAAQEISQAVFIILARKAKSLGTKIILSGWLYQTTQLTAANYLRAEIRRQNREQEAYMQSTLNESESEAWLQIAPLIEDAMARLGEKDRNAIVLRFFENKNLSEVGAAIGASEDAAKMRVNRALEKLRKFFTKRDLTLSATIIAGAVSANSVQAAPAMLAKSIAAVAIAKGSIAAASTLTLVKGTMITMTWSKMKMAMMIGATAILVAGTTTLVAQHQLQVNASLPYKMLDDACQFADSFDQTKLVVRALITSKDKAVHPADIHLTIQSAVKGSIPVQLGTNGQVLNFPHDEALRRENPRIIADQHKGTLILTVNDYLPMPEELIFPYRLLGDAVEEANNGVAKANKIIKGNYAGQLPLFTRTIQGVIFVFPKSSAGKAKVEIASTAGRREYTADATGQIKLKLDKSLLAENPQVTVSEKPRYAVPDPR